MCCQSRMASVRFCDALHQEGIGVKWAVVDLHSRDVTDHLKGKAENHSDGETPCPIEYPESKLRDNKSSEEDGEEEITAAGREVEEV